jgi:hypothetical protein
MHNTAPLITNTSGKSERGLAKPNSGNNAHMATPTSIRNDRLTPTESKIVSILLLSTLRAFSITYPGTKVR